MKIALATDHAGFDQLQKLKQFLTARGHQCLDFGPKSYDANDDYPDFIAPAAQAVAGGQAEAGIIMGGSGQGEAMAANHVSGVRCALYYGTAKAVSSIEAEGTASADQYDILRLSRQHNHANMLSLGARFLDIAEIQQAVTIWLDTPFSDVERHVRRVHKINQIKP